MGDQINILIDNLQALFLRLLDFPVAFQLLLWFSLFSLLYVSMLKMMGAFKLNELSVNAKIIAYCVGGGICIASASAALFDFKQHQQEKEFLLSTNKPSLYYSIKDSLQPYFNKYLEPLKNLSFGRASSVNYIQNDHGIEILELKFNNPCINAFLVTIDLNQYEIVLDSSILEKKLTSVFAKHNNVDIAVNGEAGSSPGKEAPLGQWVGNYIVCGKSILLKDSRYRPFISFDKNNFGKYYPDSALVLNAGPDMYNTIWGRFNLLVNGKMDIAKKDGTRNSLYPRTIVAIDKSGKRAFCLVVDGRRPIYSVGMTMAMCGETLLSVGAFNAMSCDQGGSSMMYSKKLGLINRPADGRERVVYTHLGFRQLLTKK